MVKTFMTLLFDIAAFGWWAWYWDNVLSLNRGVGKGWFFFYNPYFWFPPSKKEGDKGTRLEYDLDTVKQSKSVSLNTAINEKINAIKGE